NTTTTLLGNTTVTVDAPQAILTLNMALDDAGGAYGITKEGLGTLILGNNSTFTGGVTVNAGTLALAGLNAGSTSPVFAGTSATINNGGMLSLLNSGTASNGLISYANNIVVSGSLAAANLHVGNNGSNTGNTIEVSNLTLNGGQILNVSSQNGYNLRLLNVTTAAGIPQINVNAGARVVVFGFTPGSQPINVGQGELVFPDLVPIGTTTALNGGTPITLNGAYPLGVQNAVLTGANMTAFGYTSGGLNGAFASLATAPTAVVSTQVAGIGFSGSNFVTNLLSDGGLANRPSATTGSFTNGAAVFSGFLNVPEGQGGTYSFRSASDGGMTLFIDGVAVSSDTFGSGLLDRASTVSTTLSAGFHSIVYKATNAGGGGGFRLLYSGPDTAGKFQAIGSNRMFYTTAAPTAANGYNGAAIIDNAYYLPSGSATIDTFGTQFGAVAAPGVANRTNASGAQGAELGAEGVDG
ncbi:MAG: autotransporter-associated beta strand repeat-containing protein, partial [Verrucomicrobiota bacterium]